MIKVRKKYSNILKIFMILAPHKKNNGGKWFGGLFGKNHGSCCC